MFDTEDPDYGHDDNGNVTVTCKGKVIGDVHIEVKETGTSLGFTTDFQTNTRYKTEIEEYKSDTYEFIRAKGNPEVNKRKDGLSYIKFSLDKIKK